MRPLVALIAAVLAIALPTALSAQDTVDPAPLIVTDAATPETAPITAETTAPSADGPYRLSTFARDTGSVGWEVGGLVTAITATRLKDVTSGGASFRFKSEGFFGRDTQSLGMDKLHHAWKTYVIADVLQGIIEKRAGDRRDAATSAALISLGLMTYAEVLDGFTRRTGFSNEDFTIHFAGAGFALVRNAVPGLRQKLDFREQFNPRSLGKDLRLVDQLAERRFLFAAQLSGWKRFEDTPWRFVELHAGYYGRGFSDAERARGDRLRRRLFVGIGFNVQQLFERRPRSAIKRIARGAFDYIQLPYTSIYN